MTNILLFYCCQVNQGRPSTVKTSVKIALKTRLRPAQEMGAVLTVPPTPEQWEVALQVNLTAVSNTFPLVPHLVRQICHIVLLHVLYLFLSKNSIRGHRGLVVKALDFHAGGRGFDSRTGQAAQ